MSERPVSKTVKMVDMILSALEDPNSTRREAAVRIVKNLIRLRGPEAAHAARTIEYMLERDNRGTLIQQLRLWAKQSDDELLRYRAALVLGDKLQKERKPSKLDNVVVLYVSRAGGRLRHVAKLR